MPPCFDCGIKLERRNVVKATKEEMESKPDYDFCKWIDGSGILSLCNDCDKKRYEKEEKERMLKIEIEKHERFEKEIYDYINQCLDAKVNPDKILESFQIFIDEAIKERLEKATKK